MALTGELSDLSLAELIEFFCNQRKTGRLKVGYSDTPGVFFIKDGELVDAKIGSLSGADAIYYALTQPSASFDFSPAFQSSRRTIHQSWAQVVLEGLRRIDEGIIPDKGVVNGKQPHLSDPDFADEQPSLNGHKPFSPPLPASGAITQSSISDRVTEVQASNRRPAILFGVIAIALVGIGFIAIGALTNWFSTTKSSGNTTPANMSVANSSDEQSSTTSDPSDPATSETTESSAPPVLEDTAQSEAARLARETRAKEISERARAREARAAAARAEGTPVVPGGANPATRPNASVPSGPKTVTVRVTYDESGRVTQSSVISRSPGADAYDGAAQRIARQKRFPAGKPGATTVTIPIN